MSQSLNLEKIAASTLSAKSKGMRGSQSDLAVSDVVKQGWNILNEDLPFPLPVIKLSALEKNRAYMRAFLKQTGAWIAPHGKTSMAPQLFQMQLDDGAWAITVATAHQMAVCREFGVSRIFMANQLVGKQNVDYVINALKDDPDLDFYCLIDSEAGARLLANAVKQHGLSRPLNVLIEMGMEGYRTGFRSVSNALDLTRTIKRELPELSLRGVEGYEGVFSDCCVKGKEDKAQELFAKMRDLAKRADDEKLFADGPIILTAGGSDFYDFAARDLAIDMEKLNIQIVIRSGCYLTHDDLFYERAQQRLKERSPEFANIDPGLTPAIEVWGYVQSKPEETLAFATLGKRDISFDFELPTPTGHMKPGKPDSHCSLADDYSVLRLNDQHCYVQLPADNDIEVGDLMSFGVAHVCTTFDKWQYLMLVDDDYNVIGAIRTYF